MHACTFEGPSKNPFVLLFSIAPKKQKVNISVTFTDLESGGGPLAI